MSGGLSLIRAIIEDGARGVVAELSPDLFHGEQEIAAYGFLRTHYRRHGGLPTMETMRQNGFRLTARTEPVSYYLDFCRNRAKYNFLSQSQALYASMLREGRTDDLIGNIRETLQRINGLEIQNSVSSITQEMERIIDQYYVDQDIEGLRGITTGFEPLDRTTEGIQNGDIFIFAGRPNAGKSYYLLHMAVQAWLSGRSVLFVTMEMTSQQAARRIMGLFGGVHPDYIRRGELSSHGEELMLETVRRAEDMPPFHMVSGELRRSVDHVDAAIQELAPDIIYIDAGYLLQPSAGSRARDRREKISDVAEGLKSLALARNRPIVITVQLNREAKKSKKGNFEADLGNLAETDVLGQIATTVGLIYKPKPPIERSHRIIDITKNRDGPTHKFLANFQFNPLNFTFERELGDDGEIEDDENSASQVDVSQYQDWEA